MFLAIDVFEQKCRNEQEASCNRVFHSLYKVGRNASISIKEFYSSMMQQITTGLRVQCLTISAKLTFACKSEIFRSSHSHAIVESFDANTAISANFV